MIVRSTNNNDSNNNNINNNGNGIISLDMCCNIIGMIMCVISSCIKVIELWREIQR